jgi:Protein of unknown function (DUF3592)
MIDDSELAYDWVYLDGDDARDSGHVPQPRKIAFAIKIVLALAAFFLIWSALEHRRSIAFALHAEETTAIVTNKWIARHWYVGRRTYAHQHTHHLVSVEFTDRAGSVYRYRESVASWQWDKVKIGDTVPVWYVPSEPANFALFQRYRFPQEWVLAFGGAISLMLAAWFAFEYLATRNRQRPFMPGLQARLAKRKARRTRALARRQSLYRPMI